MLIKNACIRGAAGMDKTWQFAYTLNNPNAYSTSANDEFGYSVAISGDYAIVGARYEDDAGGSGSGKAYIFNVKTGIKVHTLNNPNAHGTSANDWFGSSVAISSNRAIVGAWNESDASGGMSGKAYIFNVTTGNLVHTLDNPSAYGTGTGDQFGSSVAIDGNYAIVGAPQERDAQTSSGKAYIFNVTTGNLLYTLDNPNAYNSTYRDVFGYAVAISGNYAIASAWWEDDALGNQSGKAYIFNVTNGNLVRTLNNPNAYGADTQDENFGAAVGISGNYAIVGTPYEDDASGTRSGKAYIFNVTNGNLVRTLNNPNAYSTSTEDFFGDAVGISNRYAIVGAHYEDDAGGSRSGKAYIFDIVTGNLVRTLDNKNAYSTTTDDNFGAAVAIDGNNAIVGAPWEDDAGSSGTGPGGSGKAYTYKLK